MAEDVDIAFLVAEFPSLSETFILRELVELRRRGVSFVIYALRKASHSRVHEAAKPLIERVLYRPPLTRLSATLTSLCVCAGAPLRSLGILGAVALALWSRPLLLLKSFRNFVAACYFAAQARRANITHIHAHFASMPATVGLAMSRLLGVKFTFTAHARDIYVDRQMLGAKAKAAERITTCTEFNRHLLRQLLPQQQEKIVRVYHGLPLDTFKPEHESHDGAPRILGVGRLEEKKGFQYLIEALAILRDRGTAFRCVLVGEGPLRQELEAAVEQRDLGDRVTFTGALTQPDVLTEYGRADLMVMPSIVADSGDHDGLPNVLLEASALEVPVVATDVGGIPELIRHDETGLVTRQRDAEALAERLAQALADPERMRELARAARERVLREFDLVRNVEQFAQAIGLAMP